MGIRNSKELGNNLFIIAKRLLENQLLCRLLVNDDKEPLAREVKEPLSLLNKNIVVVPKINEEDFDRESKIALIFPNGSINEGNGEFKDLDFHVLIYTTLDTWVINDENLRPFMIMSEIETSLKDKRINGIGVMRYEGFNLTTLTDKLSCYQMRFTINVFD
jgi:hypothetical protein